MAFVWLAACADEPAPELHLQGPTEVRVSELGPVQAPIVTKGDGTVLAPTTRVDAEGPVWSLSRSGVARIDEGQIVAEGPGQVVVSTAWGEQVVQWTLRVELHTVVWFVEPPVTLPVGGARQLRIAARAGLEDLDPGQVRWSSSDSTVLAVDGLGLASAKEIGTSYVTAQTAVGAAMVEIEVVRP